jgi:hypothetical protein
MSSGSVLASVVAALALEPSALVMVTTIGLNGVAVREAETAALVAAASP